MACGARGDVFCRECALGNILAQRQEAKRAERARVVDDKERQDAQEREDEEARKRTVRDFEMTLQGLDRSKTTTTTTTITTTRSARGEAKTKTTSETMAAGWGNNRKSNNNNTTTSTGRNGSNDDDDRPYNNETPSSDNKRPTKRKFSNLDAEELARAAAEEDRAKARRLLDSEKAEAASKAALPSFWTPSMTPAGTDTNTNANINNASEKDTKQKKTKTNHVLPVCPASRENDPHPYSLHTLVTINFTEEEEEEGGSGGRAGQNGSRNPNQKRRVCPACRKGLSNASKAVLAKPCGHVLCRSCVDKFMRPSGVTDPHAAHTHSSEAETPLRCYVCEADLTDRPPPKSDNNADKKKKREMEKKEKEKIRPGLVELRSEGTGFSAAGSNEVKKSGVSSFQC